LEETEGIQYMELFTWPIHTNFKQCTSKHTLQHDNKAAFN